MSNTFTAIYERDGDWYVAYCPEVPGANGQGRTKEEARASLAGKRYRPHLPGSSRGSVCVTFPTTQSGTPW